jgi:succinate dehydrogenase hydrophobic anchor subunit
MSTRRAELKNSESSLPWIIKIVGGAIIVFLLGLHFVVNHLVAPGGLLNYADILEYYANPIIPIIESLFLFFVVLHALLGMRSIILDLNPSPRLLPIINWGLTIIGAGAIIYGIWLLIVVTQKAAS